MAFLTSHACVRSRLLACSREKPPSHALGVHVLLTETRDQHHMVLGDQSYNQCLSIDRNAMAMGIRFSCRQPAASSRPCCFLLLHYPSLYLQYIHIKILHHQTKEASPVVGVCPQNIFQGFRGSRVWGHLLLLLTCPVFFSGFLVDLIGVQRIGGMHK